MSNEFYYRPIRNNRDSAYDALERGLGRHLAEYAEEELAKAGLLVPDAPEPLTAANGNLVWRADNTLMVTRYPDGEIAMLLNPEQEARYTPETARTQAALLLAAAEEETEVTE